MYLCLHYSAALSLIIYLQMNRVDLAIKEFKKLREKDEDSTLTQMAQAWLNLAQVIYNKFSYTNSSCRKICIVIRAKKNCKKLIIYFKN